MGRTIRNVGSSSHGGVESQTWSNLDYHQILQPTPTSTASSLSKLDRETTVQKQTVFHETSTLREDQDQSSRIPDLQSSSSFAEQRAAETTPFTAWTKTSATPFREPTATGVMTSEPRGPSSSGSNQYSEEIVRTSRQSSISGQTEPVGITVSYAPIPSTSGSSSTASSSTVEKYSGGPEHFSSQAATTGQADSVGITESHAHTPSTSRSLSQPSSSTSSQISEGTERFSSQVAVTSQTDPIGTTESYFPTPSMTFWSSRTTSNSKSGHDLEGTVGTASQPTVTSQTETISITESYAHTLSISESLSRQSSSKSEQYLEGTESLLNYATVTRQTDPVENTQSYTHTRSTYKSSSKPPISESKFLAGTGHLSPKATVTRQIDSIGSADSLSYTPSTSESPIRSSSPNSGQDWEETGYLPTQTAVTRQTDRAGVIESYSSATWTTEPPRKQPSPKTGQHSAGTDGFSSHAPGTSPTDSVDSTDSLGFPPLAIESAWSSARSNADFLTKGYQINSGEISWSTPPITAATLFPSSLPQRLDVTPLESHNSWSLVSPSWSISSLDYVTNSPLSKVPSPSLCTSYTPKTSLPSATTLTSADGGSEESHPLSSKAIGAVGGSVAAGVVVLGALFLLVRWRGGRSRGSGTRDRPVAPPDTTSTMADGYRNLIGSPNLISPRSTLIHPALRDIDNRIDSRSVGPSQQKQYPPPGFF